MSIHSDSQKTQGEANRPIYEQETIAQTTRSPVPPPSPPPQHGKRERWFIVSALIIALVLVLALGSVFVVQLAGHPTPTPTAVVTPTAQPAGPTPTAVVTPTAQPAGPTPTVVVTPTVQPAGPPPAPISALWMSNATTGWARTTNHMILRTTDGGKIWQNVTPPYAANSSTEIPPAFVSLDGTTAWVAVSEHQQPDGTFPTVVFRTSDGGQHWQQATLPQSRLGVSQVQFVNAQDGWVLSSFGGGAAGSQAVDLFRSTDGGQTWNIVARAPGAFPFHGIKSGMSWSSANTGWVTGSIAIPNTALLYRTQDAGVSWQQQSLHSSFAILSTAPPVFFSATEGLLPVTVYALKGPTVSVYTTHDGGATWSYTTMMPVASAWDFLTLQQGWVVGANGTTLFETSNGGQLWITITPGANFRDISQLDFVSASEGWAISTATGVPVLLKTTDGGQTWVQVS